MSDEDLVNAVVVLRQRIRDWGSDELDDNKLAQAFALGDIVTAAREVVYIADRLRMEAL